VVVRRDRLDAFRAGAVLRFREAAAFLPAATRFGDFLTVVRFRVLGAFRAVVRFRLEAAFRAVVVFRFLVAAAFLLAVFRTAVFRFLVAAAFLAAVFLERDVVAFRPVVPVRLRVAAAFFAAAIRLGDFLAVVRLRVAAAFFAAVFRVRVVAAFFAEVRRLRVVAAFFAAVLPVVVVRLGSIGPVDGLSAVSDRGVGRSHAGIAGSHDGAGAAGESIVLCSFASSAPGIRSVVEGSSFSVPCSSQGQSRVLRSGIVALLPLVGSLGPYPGERESMHVGPASYDAGRWMPPGPWSRSSKAGPATSACCSRRSGR